MSNFGGPRGQSNARGSQFVRAVSLTRVNGVDPTGSAIDVNGNVEYIVGFTSGIPATFANTSNTRSPFYSASATSGYTIPAQGLYEVEANVNVSGLTDGTDLGRVLREYGIYLTLNGTLVAQSVRVYPVASGIPGNPGGAQSNARPIVPLYTRCLIEANGGDTLAVRVKSNAALGAWRLVGADTVLASRFHVYPATAAVLLVERRPTTELDSSTSLI